METALIGAISRIIFFVKDVPKMAAFYHDILGLQPLGNINEDWLELQAGSCNLALHKIGKAVGGSSSSNTKIVFGVEDVVACKTLLATRGVTMGKIYVFDGMSFCDGKDPEGNTFQISSRGM